MKKIFKSFTFYFMLASILIIYMHYIGRDSKSILLIYLNPILNSLTYSTFADNVLNTGIQISCNTLLGKIYINWYIAHFITFTFFGLILDGLKSLLTKISSDSPSKD